MSLSNSITSSMQLKYDIPGWELTPEGFVLYVSIRSAWFNIHVSTSDFQNSPLALEALQRNTARFASDCDEDEALKWDYHEFIASHFLPLFDRIAPSIYHVGKLTLEDLQLRRQYYKCQLGFLNEVPQMSTVDPMELEERNFLDEFPDIGPVFKSTFPQHLPSEVQVPYENPSTIFEMIPEKVFVQGQALFWKPSWVFQESRNAVEKYCKIRDSGLLPNALLTSRLYGVVVDEKSTLRGLLYHWIDIDSNLTWDIAEQASTETRSRWASQIQRTVAALHEIDVVWGDVKAENVVIDMNGNAIVIDLEGGATKGWVDREVMDTKEGDLQGLQNLLDYIFDDNSHLRIREKEDPQFTECGTTC